VVKADGRFLQLVGMAKGKLEARPRELRSQELANMLNGEGVGGKGRGPSGYSPFAFWVSTFNARSGYHDASHACVS
jgi:hypothetical protein